MAQRDEKRFRGVLMILRVGESLPRVSRESRKGGGEVV